MRASWGDVVLAESEKTVVVEGNHYFPVESVAFERLTPSRLRTLCYWKGLASYYHVSIDGREYRNAAWSYRHPYPWVRRIRNRVAFSPAMVGTDR